MADQTEDTVVYRQWKDNKNFETKILHGIVSEDNEFVYIKRRDGIIKLSKEVVDKIEYRSRGNNYG